MKSHLVSGSEESWQLEERLDMLLILVSDPKQSMENLK